MFVQLRRVVYLLVLLQYSVCVGYATGAESKALVNCTDEAREKNITKLAQLKDDGYPKVLSDTRVPMKEANVCLGLWGEAVKKCNANYDAVEYAVGNLSIVLEELGLATGRKLEDGVIKSSINCDDQKVKKYASEYKEMIAKFNTAIGETANLVADARAKGINCRIYYDNLNQPFSRAREALSFYLPEIEEEGIEQCMQSGGMSTVKDLIEEYRRVNATVAQLDKLRGETQGCRVRSGGQDGKEMGRLIEMFMRRCESYGIVKEKIEENPKEIDLRKEKTENKGVYFVPTGETENVTEGVGSNGTVVRIKWKGVNKTLMTQELDGKYLTKFREDEKALKERWAREEEEERKRNEEEEARRRAIEEEERKRREAEEKAKKDEQDRLAKEAEARKIEEEKKARAEEEQKAKEAKEKQEEEARKAEEAKRTREELEEKRARKNRDGSVIPALLHGPLLLLLLCVLGSVLVC